MTDTAQLVWVNAPHYCAGLTVADDKVIEAAPILRWSLGKPWPHVRSYFDRKGFQVVVRSHPRPGEP